MVLQLSIIRTADGIDLPVPTYQSRYHMGLTLHAAIPTVLKLKPNERAMIPIGFCIGIPDGLCGQIISCPEIVQKQGIIVATAPQLLNPADRDPVMVYIQNISDQQQILRRGQEVAQLLITPALQVTWKDLDSLTNTVKESTDNND